VDYGAVKNRVFPRVVQSYDERDTILYSLGVGYGSDPTDESQLRFVDEGDLVAAPTMAAVLGAPGAWMADSDSTIDYTKVVHGEQSVTFVAPLPASGTVVGQTRVSAIVDKGAGRGAIVHLHRTVSDESGVVLAEVSHAVFCRSDGGLMRSDDEPDPLPSIPDGDPEIVCDLPTFPHSALLYRLSGDRNPLHASPAAALRAGFQRPILHGLATYGVAGHADLRSCCDYVPTRLRRLACRFSAPVFPGETVRTEMWVRGRAVHFRARVVERDVVVLDRGIAEVAL
jgi:acyl dehydratase